MPPFRLLILLLLWIPLPSSAGTDDIVRLEPVEGSRVKLGTTQGVIDADPETIFRVLTDYEHYAEFMPRTEKAEVRERMTDRVVFFSHLGMPILIEDVEYLCEAKFASDHRSVEFRMVPGSGKGVRQFHGSWKLEPFGTEPGKTLVTYRVFFDPMRGYAPWLFDLGTKHSLAKVIGAVRKRVGSAAAGDQK
ncbi:MAG: SRPBCC family protein [Pseudomonadota bacterium]